MTPKNIGIALLILGAVLIALSLAADALGFGYPGFGKFQLIGAIGGAITALIGVWLAFFYKREA
jgi:hypothetical protein